MLGLAGIPLGLRFRFLDPGGDGSPAAAVGEVVEGAWDDPAALERFGAGLDVVTWEFENVSAEVVRGLAERVPVHPSPEALEAAQDRWVEKQTFQRLGIPIAPSRPVSSREELDAAVAALGLPAVLKTRRFGYDGKGQALLREASDVEAAWARLGETPLVLEGFVTFRRELSLVVARSTTGETRAWPLTENVHRRGILRTSFVPAGIEGAGRAAALQEEAERHGRALLDALGYVGVLAVEFFETGDGLVANEMAPRVHNSGHWTQDGAFTSQFENHLRAILGLPLGPTGLRGSAGGGAGGGAGMVNFIGGIPERSAALGAEGPVVRALHLYDKSPRPGRKVGHLNLWGPDADAVRGALEELAGLADRTGEG
ncbi:MAG: 5-(carboxyamino)imidazole ribonucleotide synthase [Gemmatimonadales bacterium]|nr:MAG: 5-(carboxyamino)imidazole ribonucleotide synthase [Gemmatimonadales bacterium]